MHAEISYHSVSDEVRQLGLACSPNGTPNFEALCCFLGSTCFCYTQLGSTCLEEEMIRHKLPDEKTEDKPVTRSALEASSAAESCWP